MKNRLSDNVDPCQTLFEHSAPCTPKSAISLSWVVCAFQPGLASNRWGQNSVRPNHLFDPDSDHDYFFELSCVRGAGYPIITSVIYCTMRISGLSRVRTELCKLFVVPFLAPHPVQTNGESTSHRYLGDLPSSAHRQVEKLATPFRVAAHRDLRGFYQREIQQRVALFADMSQPTTLPILQVLINRCFSLRRIIE